MHGLCTCRMFKECTCPDANQRIILGKKLNMDSQQVKYWFQNRRMKMKVRSLKLFLNTHLFMVFYEYKILNIFIPQNQLKNKENSVLKQQIDKLRHEKALLIMEAMSKPCCAQCGYHPVYEKIYQKD